MYHPITSAVFGFGPWEALGASFAIIALIVVLWEIFWKGLALWHAARTGQWIWFIVFLLVHTLGVLEIVYLVWFRANKDSAPLFPFGAPTRPTSSDTSSVA